MIRSTDVAIITESISGDSFIDCLSVKEKIYGMAMHGGFANIGNSLYHVFASG